MTILDFYCLKLAVIEDSSTNIDHALRNKLYVNKYVLQVDVRISPGSHASEEAGNYDTEVVAEYEIGIMIKWNRSHID